MPAMRERHAQQRIARLQGGQIHRGVGLRTGMRLDIDILRVEQRLDPIYRQLLHDIHILTAAVIALAGIPFGIFVGQHRPLRLHHRRAGIIFRSDQLDIFFLALHLAFDRLPEIGVNVIEGQFRGQHGVQSFSIFGNKTLILTSSAGRESRCCHNQLTLHSNARMQSGCGWLGGFLINGSGQVA